MSFSPLTLFIRREREERELLGTKTTRKKIVEKLRAKATSNTAALQRTLPILGATTTPSSASVARVVGKGWQRVGDLVIQTREGQRTGRGGHTGKGISAGVHR